MKTKKVFEIFRTAEWWENKIPAILAIGYATTLKENTSLIQIMPSILIVLMSIVVGAIYVSTINDITDLEEDRKSDKSNRMSKIQSRYHWLIPSACILLGLIFFYSYLPDKLSALIYVLPWISFSLYSFKPFRLKERGIWGLLADACGAHVFIGLLMVSSITYISNHPLNITWFCLIGFWSLCFGLRGILWHQFYDRHNDLKANTTTFATNITREKFKKYERILFALEIISFCGILIYISIFILTIFLFIYLVLVYSRFKALGYKLVIVLNPQALPFQIIMLEFYQVFFPLGILLYLSFTQKWTWIVLLVHVLLFPKKLINIVNDIFYILKIAVKKHKIPIDWY